MTNKNSQNKFRVLASSRFVSPKTYLIIQGEILETKMHASIKGRPSAHVVKFKEMPEQLPYGSIERGDNTYEIRIIYQMTAESTLNS